MFNNWKDWKTTVPGFLVGLPMILGSLGITNIGHVGNLDGGWLGVLSGIGSIFLGAFSNSKGATPQ